MTDAQRLKYVYQVVDNRARSTFGNLMTGYNEVQITRELEQLVNDTNNELGRHPDDYDLWMVGYQDEITGALHGEQKPQHLRRLSELLAGPKIEK